MHWGHKVGPECEIAIGWGRDYRRDEATKLHDAFSVTMTSDGRHPPLPELRKWAFQVYNHDQD